MAIPTIQITGNVVTPDGVALASGTLVAELSQPGSALDGTTSVRVVGKVVATLGALGAVPGDFDLVANELITPAGTYYSVQIIGTTADGQPYRSRTPEKWQLAASPASIDIGAVTRLDVVPGFATPGITSMAALGIWVGDTAPAAGISYEAWLAGTPGYWGWINPSANVLVLTAPAAQVVATAIVPTLRVPVVDTFSDSSLNPALWTAVTTGAGTVVETTALDLNSGGGGLSMGDVAGVVFNESFTVADGPRTVKLDVRPDAVTFYMRLFALKVKSTIPGAATNVTDEATNVFTVNYYPYNGAGTEGKVQIFVAGVGVQPDFNWPLNAYRRIILDVTATTLRVRVTTVDEVTEEYDSGTFLWADETKGAPADNHWLVLGDLATDIADNNCLINRFELVAA